MILVKNELYHHGILGMKWGVRRFQNYDGSYTRKGLERYSKAESAYKEKRAQYANTKAAKKSGAAEKTDVKAARKELQSAKRDLNNAYDRLKKDKLADQGRDLYSSGKTITDTANRTAKIQSAIILGSFVANNVLSQTADAKTATLASALIAVGGTTVNGILAAKSSYEAKRLRAYYGHYGER